MFDKLRKSLGKSEKTNDEDYLEIDLNQSRSEQKVSVKLFVLKHYDDVNKVLEALRDGYTIAVIETRILRQKDPIELKRAISKIKKTTDALEGSIVGFRENVVIATPSFAKVEREQESLEEKKPANKYDDSAAF
ncbi:MAG TPA: cell division protein SepF [Candidatus Omnitrophota bacterium]|nr:cell division protein SepF [Candidatus Omnitrophota bacterium]